MLGEFALSVRDQLSELYQGDMFYIYNHSHMCGEYCSDVAISMSTAVMHTYGDVSLLIIECKPRGTPFINYFASFVFAQTV